MKTLALCLAIALAGCSKTKKPFEESNPFADDLPAGEDLGALKGQAQDLKTRLLAQFLVQGWVVALRDGTPVETGDSALFSGLMLSFLSCDEGAPTLKAIIDGIHANGGMVPRYFQDDPSNDRKTSRDMVIGVMYGFAWRAAKCPADRPAIEAAWAEHYAYVKGRGGDIGPGTGNDLGAMHWLWELTSQNLHARDAAATDKGIFEVGLAITAEDIKAGKKACYPMHLGALQILTAAKLGSPVKWQARKGYCNPESGMDLPLSDWLCERKSAAQWLGSEFVLNQYHYRHQRCGAWEGPDGGSDLSPAVDWLVEYSLAGGTFD